VNFYDFLSVFYDGQLKSCIDAITAATKGKLHEYAVLGHKLTLESYSDINKPDFRASENTGRKLVKISQNSENPPLYYVPHEKKDRNYGNRANIGQYANDLGYATGVTESSYLKNTSVKNSLIFVWRVSNSNGILVPSCPVLVTAKDIYFKADKKPIEIGVRYR
jgi:hypothetical protein